MMEVFYWTLAYLGAGTLTLVLGLWLSDGKLHSEGPFSALALFWMWWFCPIVGIAAGIIHTPDGIVYCFKCLTKKKAKKHAR